MNKPERFRWWHGLAFYAGVQVTAFLLKRAARRVTRTPDSREQDREFYREENLPVFAPPPIAFPVAWGINSVCTIAGGLYVLNMPWWKRGRAEYLRMQGTAWAIFAAFEAGYFGLRSPINAAVLTIAYSVVTGASLDIALRQIRDRRVVLSLVTTVAWLALANPVGVTQALWNRDPFWKAGPFVEPPAGWTK